jgi:urea carboxylase system permease
MTRRNPPMARPHPSPEVTMTQPTLVPATPRSGAGSGDSADAADLAHFGYAQQLRRRLGPYSSFAAGFSFVSILTTVFQLFALGYGFGGTTFFWTWPIVLAGQFCVALVFAELASRYPISGCIYQWSRRVSNEVVGWIAGYAMLIGQIVSVSAAAIALQVVLPNVWSGFQLVGSNPSVTSASGAENAVILGAVLIAVATVVNAIGVKVMAIVNDVGVTCELVGVGLMVALLLAHAKRGPQVVLHTTGVSTHGGAATWGFLASALMAAYVMYGFDSAGELSEETHRPRRTAPRAILRALAVSGLGGALLLIAALMAAPSLTNGDLATNGLPYVITSRLGSGVGKLLLVDVAVAVCVCTMAIQTATSRMLFSMSRDGVLPGSRILGRVSTRTGTPIVPAALVGAVAALILVVNVGQAQLFSAITSVAVVIVYAAYLLVTAPTLIRRLRRPPAPPTGADGERLFHLGRFGLPVNILAVAYGIVMMGNIAWPRAAVYDPAGGHWYLRFFAPLFLAGAAVVGGVLALVRAAERRRRSPELVAGIAAGEMAGVVAMPVAASEDLAGA